MRVFGSRMVAFAAIIRSRVACRHGDVSECATAGEITKFVKHTMTVKPPRAIIIGS